MGATQAMEVIAIVKREAEVQGRTTDHMSLETSDWWNMEVALGLGWMTCI